MEEHKDGKDFDDFIASAPDFYFLFNISNDVKKGAKEKIKVNKGKKRKNTGRKPSGVTSLQGRRTAVMKKMTKAKMGDKDTSYKEKKTSSVDNKTTKEDEKKNVFQRGSGKGW
eukprot:6575390-Ditylum_brightwellii.AAC.1